MATIINPKHIPLSDNSLISVSTLSGQYYYADVTDSSGISLTSGSGRYYIEYSITGKIGKLFCAYNPGLAVNQSGIFFQTEWIIRTEFCDSKTECYSKLLLMIESCPFQLNLPQKLEIYDSTNHY